MGHVRVGVLGPTTVSVDGAAVRLTPLTVRLLLRLVAAGGEAVTVNELYVDLWGRPPRGVIDRAQRVQVQQRVLELRQKLDPGPPPESARYPSTESVPAGQYAQSAYRLVLDQEQLDCLEFTSLVNRAATAPPATAVALLSAHSACGGASRWPTRPARTSPSRWPGRCARCTRPRALRWPVTRPSSATWTRPCPSRNASRRSSRRMPRWERSCGRCGAYSRP